MKAPLIFTLSFMIFLSGCAGQLYIHKDQKTACITENGECTKYKGVPYHPLKQVEKHYLYDRVLDSSGNIIRHYGWEKSKRCEPIVRREMSLAPNPETVYVAEYDARPFETVTFNVSLTDQGTLSSIGTSSAPGEKIATDTLISVAETVRTFSHGFKQAKAATELPRPPRPDMAVPLCDAGKVPVDPEFLEDLGEGLILRQEVEMQ